MQPTNSASQTGLYAQMVATKPPGTPKYRSFSKDLELLGAADLFEYACPKGMADPRRASSESLLRTADSRVSDYGKITPERSAAERLRSRAREVFGDESERARYEDYLRWVQLKAVFDRLDDALQTTGRVDGRALDEAQSALSELLGDEGKAQALLKDYDDELGGKLGIAAGKYCPWCGGQMAKDARFCRHCGYDLLKHVPYSPPAPQRANPWDEAAPRDVQPREGAEEKQPSWPMAVIIVALVVIAASIGVIVSTLAGQAHALSPEGTQAAAGQLTGLAEQAWRALPF